LKKLVPRIVVNFAQWPGQIKHERENSGRRQLKIMHEQNELKKVYGKPEISEAFSTQQLSETTVILVNHQPGEYQYL